MAATEEENNTPMDVVEDAETSTFRPELATDAVLVKSVPIPAGTPIVKGVEFNENPGLYEVLNGLRWSGFQATHLGKAVDQINEMISWRPNEADRAAYKASDPHITDEDIDKVRCTIFLGMTSNMCSSGTREVIRYLCEHNMIDCIVTTCGAIEEDFMKCFAPHYHGEFKLPGKELRLKGHNRIGNLLVPNNTYCKFEDWFTPIWQQMLTEQKENGEIWTPTKMIRRMGKEIDNEESVWYWCYRNNIPVFCPGITDGAVGDVIYFNSYSDDSFILEISRDLRLINDLALNAKKTGMVILGGGIVKHHICNANLMRNGADYTVFVNTGQEFDGSDSGARPEEAISWGKIRIDAKPVKVYGDATVMFPLIVAGSFARYPEIATKPPKELIAALQQTPQYAAETKEEDVMEEEPTIASSSQQ